MTEHNMDGRADGAGCRHGGRAMKAREEEKVMVHERLSDVAAAFQLSRHWRKHGLVRGSGCGGSTRG